MRQIRHPDPLGDYYCVWSGGHDADEGVRKCSDASRRSGPGPGRAGGAVRLELVSERARSPRRDDFSVRGLPLGQLQETASRSGRCPDCLEPRPHQLDGSAQPFLPRLAASVVASADERRGDDGGDQVARAGAERGAPAGPAGGGSGAEVHAEREGGRRAAAGDERAAGARVPRRGRL
jgi:hypothetical protein